jgi:hypothetical protein
VRVIERQDSREDEHFTEGEPDLEAPEELAVLEVDEESLLEEDLERSADLEDEVDEERLETSLDHLVHDGDDEGDGADDPGRTLTLAAFATVVGLETVGGGDGTDPEDLEIEDLEDRDESLDRILREKLAGDEEPGDDDQADDGMVDDGMVDDTDEPVVMSGAGTVGLKVASCGPDEFVCPSCFLVRNRAQRTNGSESLCHDCEG